MAAASSSVAMLTLPTRIGLSALPKVATAHSLTGVGVASITADPTASTGEEAGLTRAATRWPTAMPATAASPEAAYGQRLSWQLFTVFIRHRGSSGWEPLRIRDPAPRVPWPA